VADQDTIGTHGRRVEDEYFRKREQELMDKLKRKAEEQAARKHLAEQAGVFDEEILKDMEDLGYKPETLMLIHLIPLVQVAWAEGGVSDRERTLIVEAARSRGIQPGSAADRHLATLLTERPSDAFFEKTLRAITAMLDGAAPEQGEADRRNLLTYSTAIASASGGILGFARVSVEEQRVLKRITEELKHRRGDAGPAVKSSG
jgi:hypothetical protein